MQLPVQKARKYTEAEVVTKPKLDYKEVSPCCFFKASSEETPTRPMTPREKADACKSPETPRPSMSPVKAFLYGKKSVETPAVTGVLTRPASV